MSEDTIFALASGPVPAAIAIIRLSGPNAATAVRRLSGADLPPARRAVVRRLRDPITDEALDEAVVLWMPAPSSFTGEDQAELHIHGGLAVRAALLRALRAVEGCRPAEPGEFTRRAFLNGRLDLTRVEGLADLIDAETEAQRRQALRLHSGALTKAVGAWRDGLLGILALLESALDFSDEGDVPAHEAASRDAAIGRIEAEIRAALEQSARGERVREGYTVVITGAPNAGKSTLLNAIAEREVAIVSPAPGTTRDTIEVRCDLEGLPVTFVDTAGLRDSADEVEQEGVRRSLARAADADLVLWLHAADAGVQAPGPGCVSATRIMSVRTKIDTVGTELPPFGPVGPAISARHGLGVQELLGQVADRLGGPLAEAGDVLVTRERHRMALEDVLACLQRAQRPPQDGAIELVAEDVRLALRALGVLTGRVDVDEVLDRVFSQFCIGK